MATCFAMLGSFAQGVEARRDPAPIEMALARCNIPAPPAYRAFRRLEAGNAKRHAWLEAWTEFRTGRGFSYEIVGEGGSEYVRNKILRGVLERESELVAKGTPLRAAFSAKNYSFADGGVTDAGLRRILLNPARKSDGLVKGSVLLDPEGHMVRMEGRLVKSISFWLRDIDVTWTYRCFGDTIVPVEMTSDGRVRMFGPHSFRMTYDYESVDGHTVGDSLKASVRPHP
jgi:hypothetical protein